MTLPIVSCMYLLYIKFHTMNDDFQAILKLSDNSNALILDKF